MIKIVLDAGHSFNTAGKRTPNGTHEWELNNIVCKLITSNLKEYGVNITRTDDTTGKTDISLSNRVKKCNEVAPTLMVSIHHNAFKGKWGNHSGTEVLMHTLGTKQDKELASVLAPLISSKCKLTNRGVKRALLGVLGCKCTAVLCEGGFMDSNIDNPIICSLEGQVNYANAVAEGIVKYLGLKKVTKTEVKPVTKPVVKPVKKPYWYARYTCTSNMNVRASASLFSKKVKLYIKGTVFDIHEEYKGWRTFSVRVDISTIL